VRYCHRVVTGWFIKIEREGQFMVLLPFKGIQSWVRNTVQIAGRSSRPKCFQIIRRLIIGAFVDRDVKSFIWKRMTDAGTAGIPSRCWRMRWLSEIREMGLDTGHLREGYLWPVARWIITAIQSG
jgi:hypothetical protein